jgi:tRNA(Ile)-lysidine synthase
LNKKKTLLQSFLNFNASKRLSSTKKRSLLAVSGGLDSVVMCRLFSEAGFPFAIAHCNFQLRGEESEADEQFVKSLGEKYKVEVFVTRFDTKSYAIEKGLSTQVAARELRYDWFEEIRAAKKFDVIATAHHLNDNIETILFNLVKGTGIRGLRGIPVKQGRIIRPLLFASREEIAAYSEEQELSFREDSSNAEDKYTRNKIRHNVIPLLKEINPSLENTMRCKIDLFNQLEELYDAAIAKESRQLFLPRKDDVYIPILKLRKTKNASSLLFEFLKHNGFNAEQVEDMLANLDDVPGKQFLSDRARIIKDRKFFILTKLPEKDFTIKLVQESDKEIMLGDAAIAISKLPADAKISADKKIAFIDPAKLEFPLIIRRWKAGDYFYPFGMKMKKKKLKKFFVDQKVPLNEKENIWVVESNKKIVWVVGHRIDERFRVSEKSKEILRMAMVSRAV